MIYVPSNRFLEPREEIGFVTPGEGWYKIEKLKVDAYGQPIESSRTVVADWFPNLITDQGMNRFATNNDWMSACQIGSGNATPAFSNTGLQAFLAGSNTQQAQTQTAQATPPYFGTARRTYRFAAGVGTGNISEVGVGWATSGSFLFSRALILDGALAPTTITKLADEILDVTYEYRSYPPTADFTGNITITGSGVHAITTRAATVTAAVFNWTFNNFGGSRAGAATQGGDQAVYNGAIGAVTANPSGTSANSTSVALVGYSNNSFQRDATVTYGLNDANLAGGIRSLRSVFGDSAGGLGRFQTEFNPVINKTASQQLILNLRHSWARR